MVSNNLACCQDFFAAIDDGDIESDRRAGGSFGLQLLYSRKGAAQADIPEVLQSRSLQGTNALLILSKGSLKRPSY